MKNIDKKYTTNEDKLKNNTPKSIILHSTNYDSFDHILDLHINDRGWEGVGYHLFVSKGKIYCARSFNKEGAHALGFNFNSIGLCISNKDLSKKDLNLAKIAIGEIRSEYGALPVFSHTLAQIKYINDLSKKGELDLYIPEKQDIVLEDNFQNLKEEFNDLAGKLSTNKLFDLKPQIKSFKNCPGEEFYKFLLEVNPSK